jgi:hypothetical protein
MVVTEVMAAPPPPSCSSLAAGKGYYTPAVSSALRDYLRLGTGGCQDRKQRNDRERRAGDEHGPE